MKYLHEHSICHRDIKLDNILIDSKLEPKLIDFGFATCLDKEKKVKMFCGTPSFMAPEIVSKVEYRGEPADVWALGVVLFVMVAGYFPFKGQSDKELYQKICSSDYNRIQVSRGLLDLITCMLTVDADQRITAEEVFCTLFRSLNTIGSRTFQGINSLAEPQVEVGVMKSTISESH